MEPTQITTPATTENGIAENAALNIVAKKRKSWADLGELTHTLDLNLQAMAQQALMAISILPQTINDIPAAEQKLKDVKKKFTEIEAERKTVTGRLEIIKDRLMIPEKSGIAPIAAYEKQIIAVKKADEELKRIDKLKADNIKSCKEYLLKYKSDQIHSFNTAITNKVDAAYSHALGVGNITMEGLPAFMEIALAKFAAQNFTIVAPVNSFQHVSAEEYKKLTDELLVNDPTVFLKEYERLLRHKFSDYEIALNNKVQALENARIEKDAADKKALEEKKNQEIAAQLSSVAVTPIVDSGVGVKKLKSEYKIDLEETLESSIIIMSAFVANIATIQPMLKVNKFDSLTIGQMKTYLCKVKTLDETFEYAGVVFKTIDKL
jgi:hypothetical protein